MSLEQEIGRLADVLEKIEAKMGGETVATPTPTAPVKKAPAKKGAKKAAVETVTVDETPLVVAEDAMTQEEFLLHCNTTLLAIKDTAVRAKKIAAIKAMFTKEYNAANIKSVPVECIAECKTKFDTIIGA